MNNEHRHQYSPRYPELDTFEYRNIKARKYRYPDCKAVFTVYLLLVTWLIMIFPAAGSAQISLTLQECVQGGLRNNIGIKIIEEETVRAEAKLRESQSERYPYLTFQGNYVRLSDIDPFTITIPAGPGVTSRRVNVSPVFLNYYGVSAYVSQPIYTGSRIGGSIENARLQQEISILNARRTRQKSVYTITLAYWNLAGAYKKLDVIQQSLQQVKSHLRDLKNMEAEGLATRYDVLQAETRLARVRLAEITAGKTVQLIRTRLNIAMGESPGTEIFPEDEPEVIPSTRPLDDCIAEAFESRAELKRSEQLINQQRLNKKIAKAGSLPSMYLTGNFNLSRPNPRVLPAQDKWTGTWNIGIALQFNAWDWGKSRAQIEQASARIRTAKLELQNLKNEIILQVTEYYLTLTEAMERIITAQRAVEHTEENLRITRSMFQEGMATNTMILDAEQDWLEAQTDLAAAQMEYRTALAGLVFAMGADEY